MLAEATTWFVQALAVLAPAACPVEEQAAAADSEAIRVGALFVNTPTGKRHLAGIRDAQRRHDSGERIVVEELPYVTEREGDRILLEALRAGELDIILGPTDSGVFVRARALQDEIGSDIPVISSLITAQVENEHEGWFFRTNVDVVRRANSVFDHLNKRWVNSIAVVYADTEFGRRAEEAFHGELKGLKRDLYQALPFDAPSLRSPMWRVLERRPEAVGIFGEREDIVNAYEALGSMNESMAGYAPVLFTVLDIRSLASDVDDFLFVSVLRPGSGNEDPVEILRDDVFALSYDTTTFVLDVIEDMGTGPFDRKVFRDRFAKNVIGGSSEKPGELTNMRFSGSANSCQPIVYELKDGEVLAIGAGEVGLLGKVAYKLGLLRARFGLWPLLVFGAMLLTVFLASLHDIYRWYGGGVKQLIWTRHFAGLVILQAAAAFALFVFLGETGRIRYDSVLNGVIIALAPSPLLRTSLLRIGGRNIGLADQYDRVLQYLTRNLLLGGYHEPKTNIRIVAYYNSSEYLRRTWLEVLADMPNPEEAGRLRAEVGEEVERASDSFGRRLVYATHLVHRRSWEELNRLGCVPPDMSDGLDIVNPEEWISESVTYCLPDSDRTTRVAAVVEERLLRSNKRAREHFERKMRDAGEAERDILYAKIQFLVMRYSFQRNDLQREGLLPPDGEAEATPEPRSDVGVEAADESAEPAAGTGDRDVEVPRPRPEARERGSEDEEAEDDALAGPRDRS